VTTSTLTAYTSNKMDDDVIDDVTRTPYNVSAVVFSDENVDPAASSTKRNG